VLGKLRPYRQSQNMNTRLSTYLQSVGLLLPAGLVALFASTFVFPKLEQISAEAGLSTQALPYFIGTSRWLVNEWFLLFGAAFALLAVLEFTVSGWAKYRRGAALTVTGLLNTAVLVGLLVMLIWAMLAAPMLLHGK
jgi:hypothetical protein